MIIAVETVGIVALFAIATVHVPVPPALILQKLVVIAKEGEAEVEP